MSIIENYLREELRKVDKSQRRTGRAALRTMVSTGQIRRSHLENAVAPMRGYRKTIQNLTVKDLIGMGIVTVVDDSV